MTWINRLLFYFGITAILTGESITVRDSYNTLFGNQGPIHATPHITNLIRNGAQELSTNEKMDLAGLGLAVLGKNIASEMTRFIIGCVSIIQIIYMTEVGTLILKSRIPLQIGELFLIFVLRTLITLPLITAIAHFIYR